MPAACRSTIARSAADLHHSVPPRLASLKKRTHDQQGQLCSVTNAAQGHATLPEQWRGHSSSSSSSSSSSCCSSPYPPLQWPPRARRGRGSCWPAAVPHAAAAGTGRPAPVRHTSGSTGAAGRAAGWPSRQQAAQPLCGWKRVRSAGGQRLSHAHWRAAGCCLRCPCFWLNWLLSSACTDLHGSVGAAPWQPSVGGGAAEQVAA